MKLHFFHLGSKESCRQAGKSEVHLALQNYICRSLGLDQTSQEVRFEAIGRIADVCWQEKMCIFEVQCSPISEEEVRSRTLAYESLGYSVIWILHDKTFKKRRVASCELYLQSRTHYFTDMTSFEGTIYDECHLIWENRRFLASVRRPVKLSSLQEVSRGGKATPSVIERRLQTWRYRSEGDLLSSLDDEEVKASLKRLAAYEAKIKRKAPRLLSYFVQHLRSLWHFIIEQSCK
jgi:competence protein CoiA